MDKTGPRELEKMGMNNLDTCMSRYQCALPGKKLDVSGVSAGFHILYAKITRVLETQEEEL